MITISIDEEIIDAWFPKLGAEVMGVYIFLMRHGDGDAALSESFIAEKLRLSSQTVSKHLTVLRNAGLIS